MSCNSSTMGATGEAGTAYSYGAAEFTQDFCGVRMAKSLVFH